MDLSEFPPEVRILAAELQNVLRRLEREGTLKVSTIEIEYEEITIQRPTHAERIHKRVPLFVTELRRECTNLIPLLPPLGDNWEDQMESVCQEINLINNNTRNEEQLQLYYQLGTLLSQKGFNAVSKNHAKSYLLSHKQRDFFPIARRTYLLYSARGSWNIRGTVNISCYALRHMTEIDFQSILIPEAEEAKTKELLLTPFDSPSLF